MPLSEQDAIELEELKQLVRAPGFARLLAFKDREWGSEACLSKIDRALTELQPGDEDGERMTVLQIRAAAKRIDALLRWPEERIGMLQTHKQAPSLNPLNRLRRIAR